MGIQTTEMITIRNDLALDLEAGFDSYLDEVAEGYEKFFEPVLEEDEAPPDTRFQLVLLRRSVAWHRERLEELDGDVVEHSGAEVAVSAETRSATDALLAKLGFVRDTCRGVYGPASLKRVGLTGALPRYPVRLYRKARDVRRAIRNPASELQPVLEAGKDALTPAQLASELDSEIRDLGRFVGARRQGRRRGTDVRSRRRQRVEEFDYAIRGIVRTAQGIFRLAGRDDLARRFRPVFQRVLRKLDEAKKQEQEQQADADASSESGGPETAPTGEAAASSETTA